MTCAQAFQQKPGPKMCKQRLRNLPHEFCGLSCAKASQQGISLAKPQQTAKPSQQGIPLAMTQQSGIEIRFYGKGKRYYEFTNFYPCSIFMVVKGQTFLFPSSEHYFQFMKFAYLPNWFDHYQKIVQLTARQVFDYAHANNNLVNPKWHQGMKINVMRKVLKVKFAPGTQLGNLLKSTSNAHLIEDSPYDDYWGCGKKGNGKNMLGKLLEEVRTTL
jgi:ribA/ribD-fused uncharacterized protein